MIHLGLVLQQRYRVIRVLGGGGFSKVFEIDDSGIPKVLKVLNLERFSSPKSKEKAIALFQRESVVLGALKHPGIPKVEPDAYFMWVEDEQEAVHCLVMEKIEGETLQDWISHNPIPSLEQAVNWLKQLVEILQLLHERQYFHRDIKPSNIIIKPNNQLVLIDFGAVRELTETYLQKQQGNQTGTVIISAGYTPPEQAEGQAVPQSDFFALGRTFVTLLTGKSPLDFEKDSQTGDLLWQANIPQDYKKLTDLIDVLMANIPGRRPENAQVIFQYLKEEFNTNTSFNLQYFVKFICRDRSYINSKIYSPRRKRISIIQRATVGALSLSILAILGLTTDPSKVSILFNDYGLEQYKSGHLNTAKIFYDLALFFNKKNIKTHYNLGIFYEDKKEFDLARNAYQFALQGKLDKAYNNLGRLEVLDKNYVGAISLLETGLQLAKNNAEKYNLLKNWAWAELELGNLENAETKLKQAIALDPNKASAYCLLAQVREAQTQTKEAYNWWKKCLDRGSEKSPDEQLWMNMARQKINSFN